MTVPSVSVTASCICSGQTLIYFVSDVKAFITAYIQAANTRVLAANA